MNKIFFIIENPSASAMWSLPSMKSLSHGSNRVVRANTHMCCFGLVDPVSGLPMRKSMSLLSNISRELEEDVIKMCKRDHEHQTVVGSSRGFGSRAIISQVYPLPFCRAVAKTLLRLLHANESTAAPSVDVISDTEPKDVVCPNFEKNAIKVAETGGVPHPERHGSAKSQLCNTSIDGDAFWEDLAAEDDAVYRRLDELRRGQTGGQDDLSPAVPPGMPIIRDKTLKHSPKLRVEYLDLPTMALVARSVRRR